MEAKGFINFSIKRPLARQLPISNHFAKAFTYQPGPAAIRRSHLKSLDPLGEDGAFSKLRESNVPSER